MFIPVQIIQLAGGQIIFLVYIIGVNQCRKPLR
jgi:hypothetical protein